MASYKSEDICNIALVGHSGSGKTLLAEALLHNGGAINTPGSLERGTTVCDFDPQEQQLLHSLESAICSLDHQGRHINLIDTPGYPDFMARAISVLPAVETAAVVVNAQAGVEMMTQRMMEIAGERGLCRILIVNKIDAQEVDFTTVVDQIRESFGNECLPVNLPAEGGSKVVDCFFGATEGATDYSSPDAAHTQIVDQVVEVDEELMELYLEQGEELGPEQLHAPFEKALREGHLIPICFVSAHTGEGVKELLDVITKLMPNPMEANPPQFLKGEGQDAQQVEVTPDAGKSVIAHVFKVAVDPFVGKLGVFRIYQGTVKTNSQLFVGSATKAFKVAHLLKLQGKEHKEIPLGLPGDICAVSKVEEIYFDAVLHGSHDADNYYSRSMPLPPPMYGLAVKSKRRGDESKLSDAMHKLDAEDPCLRIEHNAAANETVLRGMGELHMRAVLERMKERYNVEVDTSPPSIAYRETINKSAEGHHRHKKQTGGAGQFGEVFLKVEPLPRDAGFEFVDKVVGGVIPSQFIPAVEKGVRQILDSGAIAGYPMQDIRVTVHDGKHHPVDSKEVAFVAAGKKAFMDAVSKASPMVLEPIVRIEITALGNCMGDITGDLSGKRGIISGTTALSGNRVQISAQVPLSEVSNYQSTLKSITGGEGTYTIEFSHYNPVPGKTQQELIKGFKTAEAVD